MQFTRQLISFLWLPACLLGFVAWAAIELAPYTHAEEPAKLRPEPVEESMHEFMEYVYEPAYKRLRANMAAEPAGKKQWKAIKGDALTLAEASNLLLNRLPKKDPAAWMEITGEVRTQGAKFYAAAGKGEYKAARAAYEAMITRCNACHQKFADGEYQLKP